MKSLTHYDIMFAYRHKNLKEFREVGARNVYLLRPWFIPERNYPAPKALSRTSAKCDVTFIGHYEDDGRLEVLEEVVNVDGN